MSHITRRFVAKIQEFAQRNNVLIVAFESGFSVYRIPYTAADRQAGSAGTREDG